MQADDKAERELINTYNEAIAEYSNCTAKLAGARWSLSQEEYMRLYGEAEHARIKGEQARLALEAFRQRTSN